MSLSQRTGPYFVDAGHPDFNCSASRGSPPPSLQQQRA